MFCSINLIGLRELHTLIQASRSYAMPHITDERFTLFWEHETTLSIICYPSSSYVAALFDTVTEILATPEILGVLHWD